jgi:hypothetical protein
MILVIVVLIFSTNVPPSAEALNFSTPGFEGCLFHLVDADGGLSFQTRNLFERIVTSSSGSQLWTLSTLPRNGSQKFGPIARSYELEERCSVDILVKLQPGPFHDSVLYDAFGFRIYNPKNVIIFVLSSESREAGMRIGEGREDFLLTHLFLHILGRGVSSGVRESYVFCGRCPKPHSLVLHPINPTHLEMKKFSQKMREEFHPQIIQVPIFTYYLECQWFFPKAYNPLADRFRTCYLDRLFTQNLVHRLNSTPEYIEEITLERELIRHVIHEGSKPPTGIVGALNFEWSSFHPSILQQYPHETQDRRFLYCVRGVERESFSFFFWAVPFDRWGWALLALSLVGLTLVSKGKWLDVFGALIVRQSYSTLDKNKTLVLLLFAAIVITCGYESIISSSLTVPPPIIVVRRLKDLVDSGYGILGYDNLNHTANSTVFLLLRRENISHSSVNEPPFVPNSFLDYIGTRILVSKCNGTFAPISGLQNQIDIQQDEMDQLFPGTEIKCHFVKETKWATEITLRYSGYFSTNVQTFVRSFQESGILGMFCRFWDYAHNFQARIRIEKRKYAEERAEVPFELNDPKIISIFIAWGILLGGASLTFLIESMSNIALFVIVAVEYEYEDIGIRL